MEPDRKTKKSLENFAAAALVFAAKIAIFLGMDRQAFLRSAATAYGITVARAARDVAGEEL